MNVKIFKFLTANLINRSLRKEKKLPLTFPFEFGASRQCPYKTVRRTSVEISIVCRR